MVTRMYSEPGSKNIPLGLELHTFFNLERSTTTYSIGEEGEHNVVTRLYTHLAKSDEDFNEIFDREISRKVKKEELDDDEVTRDLFRRTLYDIVRIYLVRYREFTSLYPDRRSLRKEKAAELFLVWLTAKKTPSGVETLPPQKEFSTREIALRTVFEGGTISKDKGKLYQHYTFYLKPRNRTATPNQETFKTLRNKIELFESVIAMLDNEPKKRALDELRTLKARMDKF